MKKVVVTGPTGEVGLALVEELLKNDIEVYAVVRPNSQRANRLGNDKNLHIVENNLDELDKLKDKIHEKCDVFYHLAWDLSRDHNNVEKQYKNVGYTLDAVKAAKSIGCEAFIGAGSQAEYGPISGVISPDTPTNPKLGYGMAKVAAGQMSRLLAYQLGIRHIWPRIISIYGPGDAESTMIISTIRALLEGNEPALTKGEQQWDFLYSKDCAVALRLLGERGKDGEIYCIGNGKTDSLKHYIEQIRDAIDPALKLGFGMVPYRENQVMRLDVDISNLVNDTGFAPTYSFDEGIRETIQWCKDNAPILKPEERN